MKLNKEKRQQIRSLILEEYKRKLSPLDTSLKIQKMFGYNFETRLSTIRMWFEQFYMGDESLENDPFREDLIPKKRETPKRKCVVSTPSKESSSPPQTSSSNETQTKLLFELKDQVDLLYRKINAQDCCLQLVDRFLKKLNPNYCYSSVDSEQNALGTFYTNYRFLRKKCQQIPFKVNCHNQNFYEILCDSLYPNHKNNSQKNKRNKNKVANKRTRRTVCRTKRSTRKTIKKRSSISRKKIKELNDSKWPKLPIQVKTEECDSESLRCPIDDCSHVATNQRQFTIHQSTHANPCLPIPNEKDLPATCPQCGLVVKNRLRLRIHVLQIHERPERQHCPFEGCEVNYRRQSNLRQHIRIVHTKDAKVYRCTWENCSYSSHKNEMLRKHINVHTGERPYKCVWPGCDKAFKSYSALNFHKSTHKNERNYKCQWPGCGYACNVPQNLKKHTAIHERKQTR